MPANDDDDDDSKLRQPLRMLVVIGIVSLNVLVWSAIVTIVVTILSEP
jgi:hypothetical protein